MDNKRGTVFTLITMLFIFTLTSVVVGSLIVRNRRANPTQKELENELRQALEEGFASLKIIGLGIASWYGHENYPPGSLMANGEVFDEDKLVAASWDYDFGTKIKVTNIRNNKSVVVEITDRGPAKYLVKKEGRILDLSKAAFATIADLEQGLTEVQIEVIE